MIQGIMVPEQHLQKILMLGSERGSTNVLPLGLYGLALYYYYVLRSKTCEPPTLE